MSILESKLLVNVATLGTKLRTWEEPVNLDQSTDVLLALPRKDLYEISPREV